MRLTLNDLYALKKATNLMRGRNPIHLNIDELPELKKRWNSIYIYLSKDNMGCIAQTRCMMFGDDMRFNSFVSRLDDMIEEMEFEQEAKRIQMGANKTSYFSAGAALFSAFCTALSLLSNCAGASFGGCHHYPPLILRIFLVSFGQTH